MDNRVFVAAMTAIRRRHRREEELSKLCSGAAIVLIGLLLAVFYCAAIRHIAA